MSDACALSAAFMSSANFCKLPTKVSAVYPLSLRIFAWRCSLGEVEVAFETCQYVKRRAPTQLPANASGSSMSTASRIQRTSGKTPH